MTRESAAIVRSTVELCHALHMRAIAEGVEEVAVWHALSAIGCDAVQGYYVGQAIARRRISRVGARVALVATRAEQPPRHDKT